MYAILKCLKTNTGGKKIEVILPDSGNNENVFNISEVAS